MNYFLEIVNNWSEMSLIVSTVTSFLLTVIFALIFIPVLKKRKAKQTILFYVKEHEYKNGTPTMGGLFFVLSTAIVYFLFSKKSGIATVSLVIALGFFAIGFLDDLIKVRTSDNQGLKPYQKIVFQLLISLLAGFFAIKNGLTKFYLPFSRISVDFGLFAMPFIAVVFIAVTNCVNLTDGLDGLASSVSIAYFLGFALLLFLQKTFFAETYPLIEEIDGVVWLCLNSAFALIGFLCFNVNKAKIFMGDTGSLYLGGLIGGLTVFTGNTLLLPIIGLPFVVSGISVIIQVIYFKKTGKRVFLMAPYHHHLQQKGLSESKIAYLYTVITVLATAFCLMPFAS